jgi:hypothetical protein
MSENVTIFILVSKMITECKGLFQTVVQENAKQK